MHNIWRKLELSKATGWEDVKTNVISQLLHIISSIFNLENTNLPSIEPHHHHLPSTEPQPSSPTSLTYPLIPIFLLHYTATSPLSSLPLHSPNHQPRFGRSLPLQRERETSVSGGLVIHYSFRKMNKHRKRVYDDIKNQSTLDILQPEAHAGQLVINKDPRHQLPQTIYIFVQKFQNKTALLVKKQTILFI